MAVVSTWWEEILTSGIGHQLSNLVSSLLKGELAEKSKGILLQAGKLLAEGKVEEAREALKALPGGIGKADEAIWWADLAFLRRRNLLTPVEADELEAFFAGLTEPEKDKLRLTHVLKDEDQRRHDFVVLGQIAGDVAKRQHLNMVFHRTLTDVLNAVGAHIGAGVTPMITEAERCRDRFSERIWRIFRPITAIFEGLGF